jgi:hypothetical protein
MRENSRRGVIGIVKQSEPFKNAIHQIILTVCSGYEVELQVANSARYLFQLEIIRRRWKLSTAGESEKGIA